MLLAISSFSSTSFSPSTFFSRQLPFLVDFLTFVDSLKFTSPTIILTGTSFLFYHSSLLTTDQVIEYLMKKGYTRTEAMLRQESANIDKDGRPIVDRSQELLPGRYKEAFVLLTTWIDGNLDVYKVRQKRCLLL